MKRQLRVLLAVVAVALVAAMATSQVSAAKPPPGPPPGPPPAEEMMTIYSEVLTPYKRFELADGDSLDLRRYYGGAGQAPNLIRLAPNDADGHGVDAFFNAPELHLGTQPMSAVSAEFCLELIGAPDTGLVGLALRIQDRDRHVVMAIDPETDLPEVMIQTPGPLCKTMVFEQPVQLVNRPHLVGMVYADTSGMSVAFDGVAYTLAPTADGDVVPGEVPMAMNMNLPDLFSDS